MQRALVCLLVLVWAVAASAQNSIRAHDAFTLRQALAQAKPGAQILLEPGEYTGGFYYTDLHGAPGNPIVVRAADPDHRPRFVGGGGIQFQNVSYLEIRDLVIDRSSGNSINVDDGGNLDTPSHHVTLRDLRITAPPDNNREGIKLSGLDDFRVEGCHVERTGSCGIDMVGCHRGVITRCTFKDGGAVGIQCKGGTAEVAIRACRFENPGARGVNIGGSTGLPYFRPRIEKVPAGRRCEAKDIRVEGCTFLGSDSPIAFAGADGATIRFNTFYHPKKWAVRILQETATPDFVPCRNGVVEDNLVVFRSDNWFEGGVNVGPGTAPQTFRFARNYWYCSDNPSRSRPTLPTPETAGVTGQDPLFRNPEAGDLNVKPGSPAKNVGAHALPR